MDDLARREAEKYTEVWSHEAYRKVSPGMFEAERAFARMGCQPGESLNDYGSGPARATKWFEDRGLNVLGIDHAANASETDVQVIISTLWDMTGVPDSDYAFCCDVMEHIPPEKVCEVLEQIVAKTRKAGWFRIATRPDVMGPQLLGEPLHLAVHPWNWWHAELSAHWPKVTIFKADQHDFIALVEKQE